MAEFMQSFSVLYASIPPYDFALDSLLGTLSLPTLFEADRETLDAQIIPLEIKAAIFAFPPHKAPGPDDFPVDSMPKP